MTDLCKCDWKEKIKAMWERLQTTIYGVRLNGERLIPDGQGIIDIEIGSGGVPIATEQAIGGVRSSQGDGKVSVDPLTGVMTANGQDDIADAVEQAESEIAALHETVGDDSGGLVKRMSDAETDIDTLDGDIAEIDQDIIDLTTTANRHEQDIQDIETALDGKQETLVSGTNIKTVEGQSVLGAGNLAVLPSHNPSDYNWTQCDIDSVTTSSPSRRYLPITGRIDAI